MIKLFQYNYINLSKTIIGLLTRIFLDVPHKIMVKVMDKVMDTTQFRSKKMKYQKKMTKTTSKVRMFQRLKYHHVLLNFNPIVCNKCIKRTHIKSYILLLYNSHEPTFTFNASLRFSP